MDNQNQKNIEENENFDELKKIYEIKKTTIFEKEKEVRELKTELKEITKKMQFACNHEFEREIVTSGPYREIAYICKKCYFWN